MIIGVIGSGGREHAICQKIYESKKIKQIYCFPGNAGTEPIAKNIDLDIEDFEAINKVVIKKKIDFLIVGPEKPLANGIVDFFKKRNIRIFGPEKIPSQLESSKIFTKKLCKKYNIPTANFGLFKNINEIEKFLDEAKFPIVIKADGLAAGKGVYICEDKLKAINAAKEIISGKFGDSKNILVEEFLKGDEMSYFVIADDLTFKSFQTAQDHKRVFEKDKGPNTGGMGSYSPSKLINKNLEEKIINKIIKPTFKGLKEMGVNYNGFLYAGLMIVKNEPYLIEYNVRMGDPECQTILPKLKTDLVDILIACSENKLSSVNIEWNEEPSLCIVLCSKGYPERYEKNILIKNFDKIKLGKKEFIFHAGTKTKENKIYSNGGRVLNFVVMSNDFKTSRNKAIKLINILDWSNGFYRKDIGYKVIE